MLFIDKDGTKWYCFATEQKVVQNVYTGRVRMSKFLFSVLLFLVAIVLLGIAGLAGVQTLVSPPELLVDGDKYISLPAIPVESDPGIVLGENATGLSKYDSTLGTLVDSPSAVLMGEGYKVSNAGTVPISFSAYVDEEGLDTFVALPKAGWNLIGSPYTYSIDWATVMVSDGTKTVSMTEATKTESWLDSAVLYTKPGETAPASVNLESDFRTSSVLKPWFGYWVRSRKDNLALIIPGTPGVGGSTDMEAPTLLIGDIPQPTLAGSITLSGTASDNVGLSSIKWATASNSGVCTGTTSWSADIPVNVGDNLVQITAKDSSGNSTAKTVRVYCGRTIAGKLDFQDYSGPMPVSMPISYYDNSGTLIGTSVATIATDGKYTAWAPKDSCIIAVKSKTFLQRAASISTNSANIIGANFSLINGDCDGDNEVTSTDLSILGLGLGATLGVASYDATADLDGDGEVTSTDLSVLGLVLGLTGD